MRRVLPALLVLALPAAEAAAVTVRTYTGDATFNTLCAASNGFGPGIGGNQACEIAVGELRIGNRNANDMGVHEIGINVPQETPDGSGTFNGFGLGPRAGFAWANGTAYDFVFWHDPITGTVALAVGASFDATTGAVTGGTTVATDLVTGFAPANDIRSMDEVASLQIRTNYNNGAGTNAGNTFTGFASLTDLVFYESDLTANSLPDNVPAAAGGANAAYIAVGGFDFTGFWALTGRTLFSWTGSGNPTQSALNHNFKLTDLRAVPLPAAGWFLLGALGALYLAGRRSRAEG